MFVGVYGLDIWEKCLEYQEPYLVKLFNFASTYAVHSWCWRPYRSMAVTTVTVSCYVQPCETYGTL